MHQPAVDGKTAAGEHIERGDEQEQEPEAEAHHDPERPEHRRDIRDRVVDGSMNLRGRGVDDVGRVFLQ